MLPRDGSPVKNVQLIARAFSNQHKLIRFLLTARQSGIYNIRVKSAVSVPPAKLVEMFLEKAS